MSTPSVHVCEGWLVGRQTFEDFRSYWPEQVDDATVLTGDPVEQTKALKSQPGKDIVLTGSISLAHTLIAAGIVDEYRLFVYPAVQGRGRRLFPDGTAIGHLRLVEPPTSFRSGIMLMKYAAG